MRRARLVLACTWWFPVFSGAWAGAPAVERPAVALLGVQDRSGDPRAARAVERALRDELAPFSRLLDAELTRDAVRRARLRNANDAGPEMLRRLADELGADRLVSATLHEAERRDVPSLTLSLRVYRGQDGEMTWAGFRGGSGLDSRTVLGLGEIRTVESLADRVVGRFAEALEHAVAGIPEAAGRPAPSPQAAMPPVAVVPFAGLTARDATNNAETVTEAARAALHGLGVRVVSPGCANEVLRRQTLAAWGGIDAEARAGLRDLCGAGAILTGSVERYDLAGAAGEPEPLAAIAMRLIWIDTGRIAWTGAAERSGWDRQGLFRLGRVHSRGTLTGEMTDSLARRLLREHAAASPGDGVER